MNDEVFPDPLLLLLLLLFTMLLLLLLLMLLMLELVVPSKECKLVLSRSPLECCEDECTETLSSFQIELVEKREPRRILREEVGTPAWVAVEDEVGMSMALDDGEGDEPDTANEMESMVGKPNVSW